MGYSHLFSIRNWHIGFHVWMPAIIMYIFLRCVLPHRNLCNKQHQVDGRALCDKMIKTLLMWVVISEKEWVVETELENEPEESWEGELKLEMVVSNNKSYKVYVYCLVLLWMMRGANTSVIPSTSRTEKTLCNSSCSFCTRHSRRWMVQSKAWKWVICWYSWGWGVAKMLSSVTSSADLQRFRNSSGERKGGRVSGCHSQKFQ